MLCAILFFVFTFENETGAAHVPLFLFVLPVALWAIAFGLRGGLLAAASASVLIVSTASDLGLFDVLAGVAVLVLVGGVVGLFADGRRSAVAEVARREELSLDLIATTSFDGWFLSVNPAFTRVLGYSAEELLSRPCVEFIHPDDRSTMLAELEEQTETERDLAGAVNRYRAKDGTYRNLEWNVRVDERTKTLISFARDITDRTQDEQRAELKSRELALALEDSRETNLRLNLVTEAVVDGLVTIDANGTILRFNTSSEHLRLPTRRSDRPERERLDTRP